jgi:hypothetical protein
MRLIVVVALLLALTTSCAKHQYLSVRSNLSLDKKKGYVQEQDSIQVCYRFSGDDCPLQIQVRNNSHTPAYIDWSRSSIIIHETTLPFGEGQGSVNLGGHSVSYNSSGPFAVASHQLRGNITLPGNSTFIPPATVFRPRVMTLTSRFHKLPKGKRIRIKDTIGTVSARKTEFTEANTPFKFRTYLTVVKGQRSITFDETFWVENLYT